MLKFSRAIATIVSLTCLACGANAELLQSKMTAYQVTKVNNKEVLKKNHRS